mmetsp:Transcript_36862/g.97131  ORF Transcript_36862/g.97131 Transcript_36862/m.97131 type:complete len:431 (+) Transcript_36862:61-1353(+)
MGISFSEEEPCDLPRTGKKITVSVQCSHTGQSICFDKHRDHSITSDWTCAHVKEAIENLTGVHRQCQNLMFQGCVMEPSVTLKSVLGCELASLPKKIIFYLRVDRHRFPQSLGPFATVPVLLKAKDFDLPKLTDEFRRRGFYWDMSAGVLGRFGLRCKAEQITAQVSPTHPVTLDPALREAANVPMDAEYFVWSYPAANWERVQESDAYQLDNWEESLELEGAGAVKGFLSVGGYIYFDVDGSVVGVTTLSQLEDGESSGLHFSEPKWWRPEWTSALVEQGRFQKVTLKAMQELGAKFFLWLRPDEIIEGPENNPLSSQPEVPHGGFVYLFHDNVISDDEAALALDRYFSVGSGPQNKSTEDDTSEQPRSLYRSFTLVRGAPAISGSSAGELMDSPADEEDSDHGADVMGSFVMSTPGSRASQTPLSQHR